MTRDDAAAVTRDEAAAVTRDDAAAVTRDDAAAVTRDDAAAVTPSPAAQGASLWDEIGFWATMGVMALAALVRIWLIWIGPRGVEAGADIFDYVLVARNLAHLDNPFAGVGSGRLPLFPLLLLPGALTPIDDLVWGQLVSAAASVAAVGLTAAVARSLGVGWGGTLVAATFVAFAPDLLAWAIRPLSYAVYSLLILVGLYGVVENRSRAVWLSALLAPLTRWEGLAAAGVLAASRLTRRGAFLGWRRSLLVLLGGGFALAILAWLAPALLGSAWRQLAARIFIQLEGFALSELRQGLPEILGSLSGLWTPLRYEVARGWPEAPFRALNALAAALSLAGLLLLGRRRPRVGLVMAGILVGHLLIAAWYIPHPRYVQPGMYVLALGMGYAVTWLAAGTPVRAKAILGTGVALLLVAWTVGTMATGKEIIRARLSEWQLWQTMGAPFRELEGTTGTVVVETAWFKPYEVRQLAWYYLGRERVVLTQSYPDFPWNELTGEPIAEFRDKTPAEQWSLVEAAQAEYLVRPLYYSAFDLVARPPYQGRFERLGEWRNPDFPPPLEEANTVRQEPEPFARVALGSAAVLSSWPKVASDVQRPGHRELSQEGLELRIEAGRPEGWFGAAYPAPIEGDFLAEVALIAPPVALDGASAGLVVSQRPLGVNTSGERVVMELERRESSRFRFARLIGLMPLQEGVSEGTGDGVRLRVGRFGEWVWGEAWDEARGWRRVGQDRVEGGGPLYLGLFVSSLANNPDYAATFEELALYRLTVGPHHFVGMDLWRIR